MDIKVDLLDLTLWLDSDCVLRVLGDSLQTPLVIQYE